MNAFLTLASAGLLAGAPLVVAAQDAQAGTLTTTGMAQVEAPADMATVTLGVEAQGETSGEVLDSTSEAAEAILAALKENGIAAEDIRTGSVSLIPRYGNRDDGSMDFGEIRGYSASNTVTFDVHDLTTLGDLISEVVGSGANTLQGVSFGLDDDQDLRDQARTEAVQDAMRRAQVLAEAASITLGGIQSIVDGDAGYNGGPSPMYRMSAADAPERSVPLEPGNITVTQSVTMSWTIGE